LIISFLSFSWVFKAVGKILSIGSNIRMLYLKDQCEWLLHFSTVLPKSWPETQFFIPFHSQSSSCSHSH
jgi:hypothetical protein